MLPSRDGLRLGAASFYRQTSQKTLTSDLFQL
jgi:hypothetical protein